MEWLKKLLSFFRRKPKAERGIKLTRGGVARVREPVGPPPRTPQPRTTIRPSDGGMRKLSRHRKGRQFETRSGIDHTKRMDGEFVDISGPPKKRRGWAEDRQRN